MWSGNVPGEGGGQAATHIALSFRAFLPLEFERITNSASRYESKMSVVRGAISAYLAHPVLALASV
ncbi:MAG: hypothetical protein JRN44_03735 [Nitrososphaerota archaeon]|nr:hypothetical protein [Nitrososphaerota archaeon]MDG6947615.1 hypothetical protein [Nitrososphaerota archaeon]